MPVYVSWSEGEKVDLDIIKKYSSILHGVDAGESIPEICEMPIYQGMSFVGKEFLLYFLSIDIKPKHHFFLYFFLS